MAKALTVASVERIAPGAKRREVADARQPGLYLIVQPSGAKSWAIRYRHPATGKPKKMTLGRYPAYDLSEARTMAAEAMKGIDRGLDPIDEREAMRQAEAEARAAQADLVEHVVERFLKRYSEVKNPKSAPETRRALEREVVSRWRGRRIQDIGRKDVAELLDDILERGAPYTANRVLAALSRMGNWCVERGQLDESFARGIRKPAPETKRDRVLSTDEIIWFWQACDRVAWPFGAVAKLLLLTGQRRDEVARMTWREVDLEAAEWRIAGARTKNGKAHVVPLAPQAIDLLKGLPNIGGEFVFTTNGTTPVSGFAKAKRKIDAAMLEAAQADTDDPASAQIPAWRFHDLRRTAASGMASLRIAPHVVEAVLNHRSGIVSGVAAVYNRFDYLDEKTAALAAWGARVDQLVSGDQSDAKVVALHG